MYLGAFLVRMFGWPNRKFKSIGFNFRSGPYVFDLNPKTDIQKMNQNPTDISIIQNLN